MSKSVRAWTVCLTAGLFFFYEFIQMNMFNVISVSFMESFHLSAQLMGWVDSFYFAANVLFLLLAGYLLDHFSIRRVILSAMFLCVLGTLLLSFTYVTYLAMLFRFMTGVGSAFCFLSCIRLATHWFPKQKIGLVIGVILTEAMIGGVFSQTPLTILVRALDWRMALLVDSLVGIILWIILYWVIRDRPDDHCVSEQDCARPILSYWAGFRLAFLQPYNWLAAFYTGLMNLPLALLGGLWGIMYLTTRFHVSPLEASWVTSFLFIGMMIGSPVIGWVSDKVSSRRMLMLVGACVMLVVFCLFLKMPMWSEASLIALFFSIGFLSGFQVISYPLVAQASPLAIVAMSVSVVNITVQGVVGLSRPFSGWLLDKHHASHHLGASLVASDYTWVMWGMPIAFVVAFIMILFLRTQKNRASTEELVSH